MMLAKPAKAETVARNTNSKLTVSFHDFPLMSSQDSVSVLCQELFGIQ
jgi:hypothetical protein